MYPWAPRSRLGRRWAPYRGGQSYQTRFAGATDHTGCPGIGRRVVPISWLGPDLVQPGNKPMFPNQAIKRSAKIKVNGYIDNGATALSRA